MTDTRRAPDPLAQLARLPKGAWLILRHYEAGDRAALAARVVIAARRRGIRVLIAGDGRLAAAARAFGVHLPDHALARARFTIPAHLAVTAAVHGPRAAHLAGLRRMDAALVSPVFATDSHLGADPLDKLRAMTLGRSCRGPAFALGGIDRQTVRRLSDTQFCGIAGIGFVRD